CLRMKSAPPATVEEPVHQEPEQIRWRPQDEVRVPRYGTGRVEHASLDEVEVRFADGSSRRFVASYVQPAKDPPDDAAVMPQVAQPAAATRGAGTRDVGQARVGG